MKNLFKIAAIVAATAGLFACNKLEEPNVVKNDQLQETPTTKAIADKEALGYPILACYVETNDVNPLNAGDYYLTTMDVPIIDIVELFASNIHKETVDNQVRPTLFLNDKLTNVLENGGVDTYVKPLQDKGIKVLLTVLGDWQEIGLANMTDTQADQFAEILAYVVEKYGLDGIGFDDEYSGSYVENNTSYSRIITKLHELMPQNKLITVFDWGATDTISEEAADLIDYAYHGYFRSYRSSSLSDVAGMDKPRWSPLSFNLGQSNTVSSIRSQATRAKNEDYGAMMFFNLRPSNDMNPLPSLQAISDGAYGGDVVYVVDGGGNRARTAGSVPSGYTITYEMATAN